MIIGKNHNRLNRVAVASVSIISTAMWHAWFSVQMPYLWDPFVSVSPDAAVGGACGLQYHRSSSRGQGY